MNKISKEKKQQIVLVLLGTGAVIALLWYGVIKNQYSSLEAVRKKTVEMKDKVAQGERMLKRAADVEATLETETKALETIEESMASGDLYLWMINTINRFNQMRRVTIFDFQRESLGEVGVLPKFPYKAATFPLKGTGYYHEIGKLLSEFENNFPYIRIQNLELSPSGSRLGDDGEKLTFKFEIVTLIKPTTQ